MAVYFENLDFVQYSIADNYFSTCLKLMWKKSTQKKRFRYCTNSKSERLNIFLPDDVVSYKDPLCELACHRQFITLLYLQITKALSKAANRVFLKEIIPKKKYKLLSGWSENVKHYHKKVRNFI